MTVDSNLGKLRDATLEIKAKLRVAQHFKSAEVSWGLIAANELTTVNFKWLDFRTAIAFAKLEIANISAAGSFESAINLLSSTIAVRATNPQVVT